MTWLDWVLSALLFVLAIGVRTLAAVALSRAASSEQCVYGIDKRELILAGLSDIETRLEIIKPIGRCCCSLLPSGQECCLHHVTAMLELVGRVRKHVRDEV